MLVSMLRQRGMVRPVCTLIIAFLWLSVPGFSATHYINDGSTAGDLYTTAVGNNGNAGTAAAPYLSLGYVLANVALSSGDTIFIDAGTYSDFNLTLGTAGVTIMGAGQLLTIFDNTFSGTGRRFLSIGANNCTVRDLGVTGYTTTTPGEGKAITISSVNNVELNQVSLYNNGTSGGEPALYVSGGGALHAVTVRNCTIQNNNTGASPYGGGVQIDGSSNNLDVDLINCFINNNTKASSFGGGVRIDGSPVVDIDYCTINNNSAQSGGGLYIGGSAIVTMTNSCASFNTSTANTGSDGGGGIHVANASVSLDNMLLEGNTASQYGGGVFVRGNFTNITFQITNTMFRSNTGERGSGLHISSGVAATVSNCLFYDNHATGTGFVDGGTINVRSTSVPTDNSLELYNTTITENTAADEGGLVNENTTVINAYNCIFWNNQGSDVFDGGTGNVNVSYSIIDNAGGPSYTNVGFNSTSDPLFLDAANDDFRIGNTSPGFDAGTTNGGLAPTSDMVTTTRTATPDMGAFEVGATQVTVYNACLIDPCIPIVSAAAVTDVPCHLGSNGSIDLTIVNGGCNGGDVFSWTNSGGTVVGTSEDLTNVPAGIYYVTINGTDTYGPYVITQPALVVASFTGLSDSICGNGTPLTLTGNFAPDGVFTGSGVTDGGNGTGTFDPSGLAAGVYPITYTYTYNAVCTADSTLNVTVLSAPVAEAGTSTTVCDGTTVTLGGTPSVTGGTGPFTYSWTPNTGLSASNVANPDATPGSTTGYTLTVTDANNCVDTDTVTVNVNSNPVADAGSASALCDGAQVSLGGSPTGSGGTGALTYLWTPGAGLNDATLSNPDVSPSSTGSYLVLVTDANNCTDTASVQITVNPTPTADAGSATTTCDGTQVSLGGSPTGSGGTGALTYLWTPGTGLNDATLANPDVSPSSTGSYLVLVTDANNCTDTASVQITVNPTPTADAGSATTTCDGTQVSLGGSPTGSGGTGTLTYLWTPGTGLNDATLANPDVSPSSTGTYQVVVSDANNCTDTASVQITVNPTPTADAGSATTTCDGTQVSLGGSPTGSGGTGTLTYLWTPGTGLNDATLANPDVSPSSTGTYQVVVSDANNCTDTASVQITVNPTPTADAGSATTICDGTQVSLGGSPTGSGGTGTLTYLWTPGTGLNDATLANPDVSPSSTGTYQVVVSDANNCTDTASVQITVNPTPTADAGSATTTCDGTQVSLGGSPTGSGGTGTLTYLWTPGAGLNDATLANPDVSPSSTGSYLVLVTDANNCTDTASIAITVNPTPIADAGVPALTLCANDSAALGGSPTGTGGTGALTYLWSPAAGLNDASLANPIATPTSSTTYTVTVSDANNCTATSTVAVTVNPRPIADAGAVTATICAGSSLSLGGSPTGSGGTGTLSYSWSPSAGLNNSLDPNPTATPAGTSTYVVTVTDVNGCVDLDSIQVTVNPLPVIDISGLMIQDANCGNSNGSITGILATGVPTLTYNWDDGNGTVGTTLDLLNQPSGTYVLTVMDGNGCVVSAGPFGINDIGGPVLNVVGIALADDTCGQSAGSITGLTVGGGSGSLTYTWTNGMGINVGSGVDLFNMPAGTYTVVVTDSAGCASVTGPFVLNDVPGPMIDLNTLLLASDTCGQSTAGVTGIQVTGGTGNLGYQWLDSTNTLVSSLPDLQGVSDGAYMLVVTDAAGCVDTAGAFVLTTVSGPGILDANAVVTDATCGQPDGSITGLTVTGGTPAYTYQWTSNGSPVGNTLDLLNVGAGTYVLTVTDAAGCMSVSQPFVISDLNGPSLDLNNVLVGDAFCGMSNGSISGIVVTGGSAPLSYQWTNNGVNVDTTLDLNGLSAGDYILIVTDANGCTSATGPYTVNDLAGPTIDASLFNLVDAGCGLSNGGINGISATGNGTLTYSWHDGSTVVGTTADLSSLPAGSYTLTVTDTNGCTATSGPHDILSTTGPVTDLSGLGISDENCGALDGSISGIVVTGGTTPYTFEWSLSGSVVSTSTTSADLLGLTAGTYDLLVTDSNGCTESLQVIVGGTSNADAIIDANPTFGYAPLVVDFQNLGTTTGTEDWDFGDTLGYASGNTASYTYTEVGTYLVVLTVVSPEGCVATDTITIVVEGNSDIVVPNVFSPNNDGTNDFFTPTLTNIIKVEGTILNRWGQVLYEWKTTGGGWDGYTSAGMLASEGTYYYIITAEGNDGVNYDLTGALMLIRQ